MATVHDILYCRSVDRQAAGYPFAFNLTISNNFKNISSIQLLSAEIPYSFYNISYAYTAGVTFTDTITPTNFTIATQWTAITDIQSQMLAFLQSTFPALLVTSVNYSTNTGLLSVSYGAGQLNVYANALGQLGRILGTNPSSSIVTSGAAGVLTFPNVANLYPNHTVFLQMATVGGNITTSSSVSALFRVQVNVAPGGIIFLNAGTGLYNTVNFLTPIQSLGSLSVGLVYGDGSPVQMNGVDWCFSLGVTHQ